MTGTIGNKAANGALWATFDKFGSLGIQFIVNLVLARLLFPEEFGAIGILSIFIVVCNTLIEGGFGSALIQKKRPTQTDYSTIFFWNLGLSSALYLMLFAAAPFVASFFDMPILKGVLRGLGLSLIFISVATLQTNRLQKQLAFKSIAATNILSYFLSGAISMVMAYRGFGVWSLVALQVFQGLFRTIILYLITGWHPSWRFSVASLRGLFSFGGYLLIANLLQEICKNVQGFIIGKRFSATDMGYFSQAYKLDSITSYSIPQVIVQVMFPVYSSIQDDAKKLAELLEMNVRVISFLVFPMLSVLILCSEPLILFLYGDKWVPASPYFRILCVGGMFMALQNINFYAVASRGKSNVLFWVSFYKWGMLLILLLIGMFFGMNGILWGMVISNINIYIVNSILASRYVGLPLHRQLLSLLPVVVLCASVLALSLGAIVWLSLHWALAALLFMVMYLAIAYLFKMRSLREVVAIWRRMREKQ